MFSPARFYRWLLRIYPARFREEYQEPMEQQFRDEYGEALDRRDRRRLWVRTIWDLASSVPAELARELAQDLRHALRVYRGRAYSVALAVAALGLTIGAGTGVFSVVNALLLRNLPFADPARLVEIWRSPVGALSGRSAFTEWHQGSSYLQSAATYSSSEMNLAQGREVLRVKVTESSSNFFRLLGTQPIAGRPFGPNEDLPGQTSVVVISHALWQQSFGGSPRALGSTLRLNGTLLTVIGVAPPRFDFPARTSIWIPTVFDLETVPKRGAFLLQTIGRLKLGVTMRQAQELFAAESERRNPDRMNDDEQDRAKLIPIRDQLVGSVRQAVWVLCGIVLLVLLAACANVAQLLLSRTTERRQELALRAALGASRARLVQQLTTEATTLTVAGAVLGLLVAYWSARLASSVAPPQLATQQYAVLDWCVLGFAAGLALTIGLLFGVIPAWLVGRLQPSVHLVRSQPGARDSGTRRIRAGLLAMQAALTLALVAGSLTMGRTFLKLLQSDLGFQPNNVVTLTVSPQGTKYEAGTAARQYYDDVLDRLRAVSGVEAVGGVGYLPLDNSVYMAGSLKLDSGQDLRSVILNGATPDYFRAIGTSVLAGREFVAGETWRSEPVAIVNEAFAQQAGTGTSIVGRTVTSPWTEKPYVIVGVVDSTRLAGPAHAGSPQVYWPIEEEPPRALTFVARVRGPAENYLAICQDAIRSVDYGVAIYNTKTLDDRLREVLARPRFYTTATLFFAGLAVLLAAIGIYGATSYSVAQRSHEMGVRMALGASPASVRRTVIRQSLVPVILGMAVGLIAAIASGRYLDHLIVGAQPLDLSNSATAAALLFAPAFLAAWRATARILSIDPMDAVRAE